MQINKRSLEVVGVTYEEYIDWCDKNKLIDNKKKTIKLFFEKIRNGQLVRNSKNGEIIKKNVRKEDQW